MLVRRVPIRTPSRRGTRRAASSGTSSSSSSMSAQRPPYALIDIEATNNWNATSHLRNWRGHV
eukprot:5534461-Prorocentrum_lima.AAC.1